MTLEVVSRSTCFHGTQYIYRHASKATSTPMRFAAYLPPQSSSRACPVVWFLSGLTCTEENFTTKAGAQRVAAELGLILIAPDTSPRGAEVPGDPAGAYDFGLGAGFYLDATEEPWSRHYKMASYVADELPEIVKANLPADMGRQGIMGHSMGGHGALTIALKHPGRYAAVSAFAPITAPIESPWGQKAFALYLGDDRRTWRQYDACALIEDGHRIAELLVDQGTDDPFLDTQLLPDRLEAVCRKAGIALQLRRQPGYDHSYYFIATFIESHLRWHAERLR
ncbi:MAG TPA: S-formylglutathione hydrolase [Alphaproteobacteria bacterium]|jgi:S-formylglutathione hydrolase|nr:S-formylglutathione hydrolase [Alphaproteobacteria bacterium]